MKKCDDWRVLVLLFSFVFVVIEAAASFAGVLVRGPYLQNGSESQMTIKWRVANSDAAVNTVYYGEAPELLSGKKTDSSSISFSAVCGKGCKNQFLEKTVQLTKLKPDTRYFYAIGTRTQPITGIEARGSFYTSPQAGAEKPTRIWVLGDSGTANENAERVRDAYKKYAKDRSADMMIMLGDNAYESGTDEEYQAAVFDMYPEELRNIPLWATLGNHDGISANSGNQTGVYYNIFDLPKNGEAGGLPSGTEAYYSFDYGNIHFVSLDSFETRRGPKDPMARWLTQDLSSTDKEWIIAFWHHPPYSKGSQDSDKIQISKLMRGNINPILESFGVDLILTGHSHSYERSYLIDGHYGDSSEVSRKPQLILDSGNGWSEPEPNADGAYTKVLKGGLTEGHDGAVYAVAGSSGKMSRSALNHPVMKVGLNRLGSMVLDVHANRLNAIFLDDTGDIGDHFSIVHEPDNSAPEIFSISVKDKQTLEVLFSEPLDEASAETIANYEIGRVRVLRAQLSDDARKVTLEITPLPEGRSILTVSNLFDFQKNNLIPAGGLKRSFLNGDEDEPGEISEFVEVIFQDGGFPDSSYRGTRDTFVRATSPNDNFGKLTWIEVDQSDKDPLSGKIGEVLSLVAWDVSAIPEQAEIKSAEIVLTVTNSSKGNFFLHEASNPWAEGVLNWHLMDAWDLEDGVNFHESEVLAKMQPLQEGRNLVALNDKGLQIVQNWIRGFHNNGLVIRTETKDGIDMVSSEGSPSSRPILKITYAIKKNTEKDTLEPVVVAPADRVIEALGERTVVDLGEPDVSDDVGVVSISNDMPADGFEVGTTQVEWSAKDPAGNVGTDKQLVKVIKSEKESSQLSFRQGVAGYSGSQDALLRETAPDSSDGSSDELYVDGRDRDPNNRRLSGEVASVIRWDLETFPEGSVLESAFITLNITKQSRRKYQIFAMTNTWVESDVNWNSLSNPNASSNVRIADFIPKQLGTNIIKINDAGLDLIRDWIDGDVENNGIVLRAGRTASGFNFIANEGEINGRPQLTLNFQALPIVGVAKKSSPPSILSQAFQDGVDPVSSYDGTHDAFIREIEPQVNFGRDPVLKSDGQDREVGESQSGELLSVLAWNLSSIPQDAHIESAELRVDILDKSNQDHHLYLVKDTWNEDKVNWESFDSTSSLGTAPLAVLSRRQTGLKTLEFNKKGVETVQAWVNGTLKNNGVALRSRGLNDGLEIGASEHGQSSSRPKLTIRYSMPAL